jgi:uncharacterized protein YyaL (SSP411 family)
LLEPVWSKWRPAQVLAVAPPEAIAASVIPLLRDRSAIGGVPTAYVCRGFTCDLPVTEPAALERQLGGAIPTER